VIGLDTNVLVRLVTGDDSEQQQLARRYLAKHCTPDDPAWIDRVVSVEIAWVLDRAYRYSREQIADTIEKLLDTAEFAFEDQDLIRSALASYRTGAGFSDALISEANARHGCSRTFTFDAGAARQLDAFELIQPFG
jgi:predicted nucleic-acid-binding protein